ncbi:MAG: sodium-dependent transporter [Raoultibacter sp.]|jgi:NSS family neurotransmitter:Na+ symporter
MSTEKDISTRAQWSGKWMFILAAAGSAVGLGNLWRFPYLAAKYDGGTFVWVYFVFVFTIGVSLLLLETALGRKTGKSVIGAFRSFGKKYAFIGVFTAAIPMIIAPYYCIIGGWITKYMVAYLVDGPAALADGGVYFTNFISSNVESYFWMLAFMALTFTIVAFGVQKGIEKANLILMPALLIMAAGVAVFTLMQPGALGGAAYYLIPDVSKITPELLIAALGQTFFSLSLAMAIMITYGSYLSKKESLTQSVTRIAGFGFSVAFLAGLAIVPAAFSALGSGEAVAENSGPDLMFIVLPQIFANMGSAATAIGFVFFLLVLFAAITSSISVIEAGVSIVSDETKLTRIQSLFVVMLTVVLGGIFVNAGYNILSFIEPLGADSTLLGFFDFISNSVMMPLAAILTCIFVGWIIKPKTLVDEIKLSSSFRLEGAWTIMVKYVAPVLVFLILVSFVGAQFGLFSM